MKKITINGKNYLGSMDVSDAGVTLSGFIEVGGEITEADILEYLRKENLGELEEKRTFGGNGVSYSDGDLTPEESIVLQVGKLQMKLAKSKAVAGLENTLFDKYMGK